ncbi:hypothetical protein SAMN05444392_11919 [Seinonella peptonophila]|uniref:Uncharacterized protein n=1 Tax=Seinonella peptonophila TaxID=112248 RepID=A0A1M5B7Q4_9BACL|nr:hypothetical protein SAMN05444392_11919 [Seinonella peptonophila]
MKGHEPTVRTVNELTLLGRSEDEDLLRRNCDGQAELAVLVPLRQEVVRAALERHLPEELLLVSRHPLHQLAESLLVQSKRSTRLGAGEVEEHPPPIERQAIPLTVGTRGGDPEFPQVHLNRQLCTFLYRTAQRLGCT